MSCLHYSIGSGRHQGARSGLLLTALLALQAPFAHLSAQGTMVTRGAPAEVGMSAGVLAGGVALYEEAVERGDLVGAVLLVAKDGKVVLHEAVGWRDRARAIPMEPNTLFRMASNTKPVVATGVAMLVEDDRLAYSDLVREHMPEWDNYRAGFINIGHLLSHSSGLRIPTLFLRPYMEPSAEHPDAPTLQQEAARFGSVGAEVTPRHQLQLQQPGLQHPRRARRDGVGDADGRIPRRRAVHPAGDGRQLSPRSRREDGRQARPHVRRLLPARRRGRLDARMDPRRSAPGAVRAGFGRNDLDRRRLRHLLPDVS